MTSVMRPAMNDCHAAWEAWYATLDERGPSAREAVAAAPASKQPPRSSSDAHTLLRRTLAYLPDNSSIEADVKAWLA